MIDTHKKQLTDLFIRYYGIPPVDVVMISPHASDRIYYRLSSGDKNCIGTYSAQLDVNQSFFKIATLLAHAVIPCAQVLIVNKQGDYYLQEDLGSYNALECIERNPDSLENILEKSLFLAGDMHQRTEAPRNQNIADALEVIKGDMDNFMNDFIKQLFTKAPEGLNAELERIYSLFTEIPNSSYSFVHRDFQLRNIVVSGEKLSVVDFQNALYAPRAYDIASLLFSSRLDVSISEIDDYIRRYVIHVLNNHQQTLTVDLRKQVYVMGLCRVVQALGAYGRVGIRGNKKQFLDSIAKGQRNLSKILQVLTNDYGESFPVLDNLAREPLIFPKEVRSIPVELVSFSYASHQFPELHPRHINLVFDARMFNNPGRHPTLKLLTGKDKEIQDFVTQSPEFVLFVNTITNTILSIYQSSYPYSAPITKVCVYVGCTGGRHRSVSSVELVAQQLSGSGLMVHKKHLNL